MNTKLTKITWVFLTFTMLIVMIIVFAITTSAADTVATLGVGSIALF